LEKPNGFVETPLEKDMRKKLTKWFGALSKKSGHERGKMTEFNFETILKKVESTTLSNIVTYHLQNLKINVKSKNFKNNTLDLEQSGGFSMSACKECPWEEKWIQNICVECQIDNSKKIIQEIKRVYLDTFDIMTVTDIVKKSPVKSPELENLKKQVEFLKENYFSNNDSKGKMVMVLVDKFQKN